MERRASEDLLPVLADRVIPPEPSRRRSTRSRRIAVALAAVILLCFAAGAYAYRKNYGAFATAAPDRLDFCGRRYGRLGEQPAKGVRLDGMKVAFRAPPVIGRQVLYDPRTRVGATCAGDLYRRASDRRILHYSLLGGP